MIEFKDPHRRAFSSAVNMGDDGPGDVSDRNYESESENENGNSNGPGMCISG